MSRNLETKQRKQSGMKNRKSKNVCVCVIPLDTENTSMCVHHFVRQSGKCTRERDRESNNGAYSVKNTKSCLIENAAKKSGSQKEHWGKNDLRSIRERRKNSTLLNRSMRCH